MIVTVHVPSLQQEFKLELGGDMELGILKLILEGDSGVEQEKMRVFRGDQQLADDSTTLNGYGLKHTDKLSVLIPGEIITTPTWFVRTQDNEDPATVFRHMQNDPYALAHLGQNAPVLADAVKANDLAKFTENFNQAIAAQQKRAADDKNMRARLAQNPNDTEAKAFMDNVARQKEVDANMHHAMEHYPEAFSQVHMLYILCKVNGHSVKAFVDSGAQMTIMNEACAKRCGIDRLLDTRFQGTAKGVGTSKILGRVHAADVLLGGGYMACTINVLEGQNIEMLLGLDMLKRHQCSIDLKKNVLHIGTTGGETPFLSENELPKEIDITQVEPSTPTPTTPSAINTTTPTAPESKFDAQSIQRLVDFGFERAQVIRVLEMTEGNVDMAANLLMGQ